MQVNKAGLLVCRVHALSDCTACGKQLQQQLRKLQQAVSYSLCSAAVYQVHMLFVQSRTQSPLFAVVSSVVNCVVPSAKRAANQLLSSAPAAHGLQEMHQLNALTALTDASIALH